MNIVRIWKLTCFDDSVMTTHTPYVQKKHFIYSNTFVEGSACDDVSSVGEACASRADALVLWATRFRASLTVCTPRFTHRAAAHVKTITAWHWLATLILIPLQVTLLTADI